ncbi:PfkB family carbohydrate kinase [Hydrogenophaga sp. 5NK40-0174]|uniref:PfkB family carbohydrate kinase n=1 Tax=Hydrogenophaga sp. 5NK40-0174 TaxID=3127649 RepID=UPI0031036E34
MTQSTVTPFVATAGEALIDLIVESDGRLRPCHGGAVYNLTLALGRQGASPLYLNPLSADRFGRSMARALEQAGALTANPQGVVSPTSLAIAELDAQGKASYSFYRDGVADRQVSADEMNRQCTAATSIKAVASGCLALVAEDQGKYLPWLKAQRAAGRLVVVDANLRPAIVDDMAAYCSSVMAALGEAHLIKVSDDDLQILGFDGKPVDAAWQLLKQTRAPWIALTLGAQGAMLLDRTGRAWMATETGPVTVVDTVGAGDCFLAGMVVALLQLTHDDLPHATLSNEEVTAVLQRAVASASLCVQQVGCEPPSAADIAARLQKHAPAVRAVQTGIH